MARSRTNELLVGDVGRWEQSIDRSETERYPMSGPPPRGVVSALVPSSVRGQTDY
jgi:hypothetical protein